MRYKKIVRSKSLFNSNLINMALEDEDHDNQDQKNGNQYEIKRKSRSNKVYHPFDCKSHAVIFGKNN